MQEFEEAVQLAAEHGACVDALGELREMNGWDEFFAHGKAPHWASWYAKEVIMERWLEAESVIMQDAKWACCYAECVIKGRWIEAEPVIMREPHLAFWYAKDVIRGRWLEAEPVIARDPYWASCYKTLFGVSLQEK